jgi:hypothetical protein
MDLVQAKPFSRKKKVAPKEKEMPGLARFLLSVVWVASLPRPSSAVHCFNQLQTIQSTTRAEYGKIFMSALEANYNPTGQAESTNCAEFNADDASESVITCERYRVPIHTRADEEGPAVSHPQWEGGGEREIIFVQDLEEARLSHKLRMSPTVLKGRGL